MIILGAILALVGWLTGIAILFWIGIILLIIGLVLLAPGPWAGTGPRRRYYY